MSEGNDATPRSVGAHVGAALAARGMSRRDLARGIGVNESTVTRLIRGDITMSVRTLEAIAREVGYDPCVLLRGDLDAQPCGGAA